MNLLCQDGIALIERTLGQCNRNDCIIKNEENNVDYDVQLILDDFSNLPVHNV